jgi:competence protein ComEC
MASLPPVARLAVAFAAGAALVQIPGAPHLPGPLLLLLSLPPILASPRPGHRAPWMLPCVAALLVGAACVPRPTCPELPSRAVPGVVVGRFLAALPGAPGDAAASHGRFSSGAVPFAVEGGGRCAPVRVVAPGAVAVGVRSTVWGTWRPGRSGATLVADSLAGAPEAHRGWAALRWTLVRWRGRLAAALGRLYGSRAPLAAALVLARREGLDPGLRDAFARAGTAHLLAISGFHVGVVAALLLALLRRAGLSRRGAGVGAAAGAWAYVALLGFPDAACRAALILVLLALSRAWGRVPARWGALGGALLVMVAAQPSRITGPGFQLSFAGATGLVAWAPRLRRLLRRVLGAGAPRAVVSALAAGVAATLATLPVVAWHFERVSLVGIPSTLAVTPLVALAIPGLLVSLVAHALHPALGHLVAAVVSPLLALVELCTRWMGSFPWASVWVPRSWLPVAGGGVLVGLGLVGRIPRVRRRARLVVAATAGLCAVAVWPLLLTLQARGSLEIDMLDVGQGDAFALRTPGNRWFLIDTGPAAMNPDPGANGVVRALRRRGVHRLEALVLTHPDMDHIGGAEAVLESFRVGAVLEPARPSGKDAYVGTLDVARARGVRWIQAHDGEHFVVDGVAFDVLSPPEPGSPGDTLQGAGTDTNLESVVMAVHYGAFDALFTGDAPALVERAVSGRLGQGVEVLKVSHHGSATGTDPLFLDRAAPQLALISVGRGNRFGHPSPAVLAQLRQAGVEIHRTDEEGPVRVLARADGHFQVESRGVHPRATPRSTRGSPAPAGSPR